MVKINEINMKKSAEMIILTNYLAEYGVNCPSLLETIENIMIPVSIKKRMPIFQQGDLLQNLYFLPQGIVRYFILSNEGKEITKSLRQGPAFLCSTYAMAKNTRAPFTIEALHDSTVFIITIKKWYQLIDEYPEFAKFYIKFLEDLFILKERNELSLLQDSPKIRYQHFLTRYEKYLDIIPQWMIATCLGITPEALSRLRKRCP